VEDLTFYRQLAHRCPSGYQAYTMAPISVRDRVNPRAIMRWKGLGELKKKNPITSSEFEPTTLQLVAWGFNQLCQHVPLQYKTTV
jgi:hypothetical protein